MAVPFLVVVLAVFVAADPTDGRDDRETAGQDDGRRAGTGAAAGTGGEKSSDDATLFEAARLASAAAHEIQVEADLAVLFSATRSDADRTAWEARAAPTDQAISDLTKVLETIDADELDVRTRSARSLMGEKAAESPQQARTIVGAGETAWPATMNLYKAISDAFVEGSLRFANSTSDPEVNAKARTWSIAVQIETEIAYQQAMLTGVLVVDSFGSADGMGGTIATYDNLEQSLADEESSARTLEDFGEATIRDVMRNALSGNEVSQAEELLQVVMSDPSTTQVEVTVEEWRTASGKKLDRVHTAQTGVADSIPSAADHGAGSGRADARGTSDRLSWPFVAAGIVLVVLALAAAFVLGRRTTGGRREQVES